MAAMWNRTAAAVMAVCAGAVAAQTPNAQSQAEFFRTHYTKRQVHIPIRDGVKLFAAVYPPITK